MQCESKRSIHEDSDEEINRYKWIASERAGYDLGAAAVRQWVRNHWRDYLRVRWIEHLEGKCFWLELDRGDFGRLPREFPDQPALLDAVLDQLKAGRENLDLVDWAANNDISVDEVMRILESLDVNSSRLFAVGR